MIFRCVKDNSSVKTDNRVSGCHSSSLGMRLNYNLVSPRLPLLHPHTPSSITFASISILWALLHTLTSPLTVPVGPAVPLPQEAHSQAATILPPCATSDRMVERKSILGVCACVCEEEAYTSALSSVTTAQTCIGGHTPSI